MFLLSVINLACYSLFIGNPVQDILQFTIAVLLGSLGFAAVLSMVSAIASKAGNNTTLVAILGFPILIPLLITTIRFRRTPWMDWRGRSAHYIILLAALNLLVVTLAYLLFPYLWKE